MPIDPSAPSNNPLLINRVLIMPAIHRLCHMSHKIDGDAACFGQTRCCNREMLWFAGCVNAVALIPQVKKFYFHMLTSQ